MTNITSLWCDFIFIDRSRHAPIHADQSSQGYDHLQWFLLWYCTVADLIWLPLSVSLLYWLLTFISSNNRLHDCMHMRSDLVLYAYCTACYKTSERNFLYESEVKNSCSCFLLYYCTSREDRLLFFDDITVYCTYTTWPVPVLYVIVIFQDLLSPASRHKRQEAHFQANSPFVY